MKEEESKLPPLGYIPAEVAVSHYHFSRHTLLRKVREGSLRKVLVPRRTRPWVYYCEHDLRRLCKARRVSPHRYGHVSRVSKLPMPPWLAKNTIYPVPQVGVGTVYRQKQNS